MRLRTGLIIGLAAAGAAAYFDRSMMKPELMLPFTFIGGGLGHAVGQLFLMIMGKWVE